MNDHNLDINGYNVINSKMIDNFTLELELSVRFFIKNIQTRTRDVPL